MNHEEEPVALRSIFQKARSKSGGARGRRQSEKGTSANMAPILEMDIEQLEGFDTDIAETEMDGAVTPTPRAHRFGNMEKMDKIPVPDAPTPPLLVVEEISEISPTNVAIVSQITPTSVGNEDANVKIVSGIESPKEELVEIKPRARRPRANASNTSTLAERISEVGRYDPNLTSNQLRVEGGQLRDRRDGNRARTLLLPSAFVPKYSSSGIEIDDTDTDAGDGDSNNNVLSDEQRLALSGVHVNSEGKLRRKPDTGNFGHIIECYIMDTTEALMALARLLKKEFGGINVNAGTSELRMKVPIYGTLRQVVVGASGKWNGGCTLAFRKSLTDRSKLQPERFLEWVGRVRSRMREMEEEQDTS